MKALSVHLIEGIIDQVESKVNVTWVQPRVLLKPQIAELSCRLEGWIEKVKGVGDALQEAGNGPFHPLSPHSPPHSQAP